jgi:outer membrane protein TolC
MQTMIELAEQTAYPPNSAGLSSMAGVSHATGGSDKEREPFSTKPKIQPDPWFGTKEAYLREARDAARAAQARSRDARNRTTFEVERAYADLETAQRLLALYRDVQLAQAEQAYRDAVAGYGADRVEFMNVVDSLRRWLRFRLEADRAVRDLHTAHARLEGAVGGPVPRHE